MLQDDCEPLEGEKVVTTQTSDVGKLPAPLTTFVGRRHDLAEVRDRLGTTRLLTLTGAGGVGKTRLALEVAAASAAEFADGVWLVDLAPVRDPSLVASVTATALGMPDLGTGLVIDQLAAFLTPRRALIVLDNCEHLVDACADLAHALLTACPALRILATSRRALGIYGERVFAVPPLAPDDAVELLRDRATAVRPEFQVTDGNRAQVRRLCDDLDGLPLAIELAASRLRTLTVDEAVNRLENRFGLLTGGSRVARPHQRTLRALIDWSHELCTPDERLLWHRLSVFAGDFCLDAAEAVCAGDGIGGDEVLDLLDRLVVQSIVVPTEREGLPRYRLLETIRQYGRDRIAESGQERQTLQRHHNFYLALAERVADGWYGPGQEEALARLRAEHANLLAALAYDYDPQATLALTAALRFHWCAGGFLAEGRRQLDRALAAAPEPSQARSRALCAASWVALLQSDHGAADRWLAEAGELGAQQDDRVVRAHVLGLRGSLAAFQGRLAEAVPLFERAVAAHTTAGDEASVVFELFQLAAVQMDLGNPSGAETARHAVALAEAHGERWARAHAMWTLSCHAWRHGDREEALALIRAALEIERGFNEPLSAALMLETLAWIIASCGEYERAGRLLGSAGKLWRDVGADLSAFGPPHGEDHTQCAQSVVRALGPQAYEKALAEGGRHSGPDEAIAYALRNESEPTGRPPSLVPGPSPLTPREWEVAALVAEGMSNRQIASALARSPRTVHGHIENILAKLGFSCRAQIASWWTANQAATP
ncbi:ATP-binding protein [Streptomyces sp. DSM 40750]|uniref:ATP-binding protein n=1 Tax=Streptomyces sp. DSM 40750 TaxID=2801030 RepID=UPI00214ACEFC|nr:LuxR C-terminal-related transcriptional regulator [Streptomyces sp. DSM 40750]UUU19099.1 LuxR C-terminal-related transcriptional regulator [Streptomyces sp. DSM 40750]UUU27557.1 LuxR C-terminal-related transcriptional regulator [Streptomyces sp. DSM 40750]